MSSQVPVWFWRRMSRLVADQESRGGDGDSGAGERDSVMRMNLAEGCRGCQRRDCGVRSGKRLVRSQGAIVKFEVPGLKFQNLEYQTSTLVTRSDQQDSRVSLG